MTVSAFTNTSAYDHSTVPSYDRKLIDIWVAENHGDVVRSLIPSASLNADGSATAVCAVSTRSSEALALGVAVEASGVDELVTIIRNVNDSVTVDELLNDRMSDTRELVVHAGIAGAVPIVVSGAHSSIRDGRVSAIGVV